VTHRARTPLSNATARAVFIESHTSAFPKAYSTALPTAAS